MTCTNCCIYSGVTDWHKEDYDKPVCPFYRNEMDTRSYVDVVEDEYKEKEGER